MLIDKINYSFDDEIVTKFFYDSKEKKIKIYFDSFIKENKYLESEAIFIIEDWEKAKSSLYNEKRDKYEDLENHLGIFSMILDIHQFEDKLELIVNTIDDRYIKLLFIGSNISLISRSPKSE